MVKSKKHFFQRSGTRRGWTLSTTFTQYSFGSPNQSSQPKNRNKRNLNWKEKSKIVTMQMI